MRLLENQKKDGIHLKQVHDSNAGNTSSMMPSMPTRQLRPLCQQCPLFHQCRQEEDADAEQDAEEQGGKRRRSRKMPPPRRKQRKKKGGHHELLLLGAAGLANMYLKKKEEKV